MPVTVLFADLKGSMELLADRDPEDARRILDPVLQSTMDAVHRYEGTVNQVMGDGIMALFGGEIAARQPAADAPGAATRLREALALADRLGMRPPVAHGHASLGALARRAEEAERARAHLTTARTMYRDLGMRFWLHRMAADEAGLIRGDGDA